MQWTEVYPHLQGPIDCYRTETTLLRFTASCPEVHPPCTWYFQDDAAEKEEDDDVVCTNEVSFAEVMAAKRQHAMLTGNMLDLTVDASPSEMEALAKVPKNPKP